jgi:hypothetical protein
VGFGQTSQQQAFRIFQALGRINIAPKTIAYVDSVELCIVDEAPHARGK